MLPKIVAGKCGSIHALAAILELFGARAKSPDPVLLTLDIPVKGIINIETKDCLKIEAASTKRMVWVPA